MALVSTLVWTEGLQKYSKLYHKVIKRDHSGHYIIFVNEVMILYGGHMQGLLLLY